MLQEQLLLWLSKRLLQYILHRFVFMLFYILSHLCRHIKAFATSHGFRFKLVLLVLWNPSTKSTLWVKWKCPLQKRDLYRWVHLVRKLAMQVDSASLFERERSFQRVIPLYQYLPCKIPGQETFPHTYICTLLLSCFCLIGLHLETWIHRHTRSFAVDSWWFLAHDLGAECAGHCDADTVYRKSTSKVDNSEYNKHKQHTTHLYVLKPLTVAHSLFSSLL